MSIRKKNPRGYNPRLIPLAEILPASLQHWRGDKKGLLSALESQWSAIVGLPLSAKTRPVSLRGDLLVVAVDSSPLANELQFLQETILKKIRQEVPALTLTQIRFQLRAY